MPSTVIINRLTGAGPTETDITSGNTRGSASDNAYTNETSNPVLIPASDSNYSYWITTRLSRTDSNTGTVDNVKWYTDGSNNFGTGITCVGNTADTYVQATGSEGETGTVLNTTNHTGLEASPTDVFGFTSASPASLTGSLTGAGDLATMFVYQFVIASTASAGASAQETFTYKYDDTTA